MHDKNRWPGRLRLALPALTGLLLGACGSGSPTGQTSAAPPQERTALYATADSDLAALVNPFIGTKINPDGEQGTGGAVGNVFPGATLPFGMVQFSPDTAYGEIPGLGGYNYDKDVIKGFSLTHADGAGCSIQQDVPFMPFVGNIGVSPGTSLDSYQQRYSHSNEQAKPGYYQVGLGNGVNVELTATKRSGLGRFGYPSTNDAGMIINVGRNGVTTRSAKLEIVGSNVVQGSMSSGGVCGGGGYYMYFYAEFDRPFASVGTYNGSAVSPGSRSTDAGRDNGGWVKFQGGGGAIKMRVGVSYVSIDGAKRNMQTEDPIYDFDGLRGAARNAWNAALNKVQVAGGTGDERTTFYTALYHSLLHPNLFSDVDGRFIGFDNQIYTASGWDKYATYSGWDIYRSQVQLLAWLFPKVGSDMAQSLVVDADKGGGGLPKWPTNNDDTCVMAGDAGAVMVANFYAFGGKTFDTALALRYMEQGANQPGTSSRNCEIRPGLGDDLARGYIPVGARSVKGNGIWGEPSTSLEYALADGAIAQFAGYLGDAAKRDEYLRRANFWRAGYSGFSGYIDPRTAGGGFIGGYSRTDAHYYVEGNPAQYVWMVPQNYRGLFDTMGGNAAAISRLDEHFSSLNGKLDNPYAFMGNEPEHNTPWAYNFAGAPYKTQALVRRIENEQFGNRPNGLPGNDDLGASSARFLWGEMGLYPVIPGLGGLTINGPRFPQTVIRMGNGKTLTINAQGAAPGSPYIQSMRLNGQNRTSTWLPLELLGNDTTIDYVMGSTPNTGWGSAPGDAPPSSDNPDYKNARTFSSDFESGKNQPTWNDTVEYSSNVNGICCGLNHMESSTRREGVTHGGATALQYSGNDGSATTSYSYNKLFDVNIPVNANTTLGYWIYPQGSFGTDNLGNNSSYVAIDLIFTDGTSLRDSGATDQNGVRAHPEYQGRGGKLKLDAWNQVSVNVGRWMNGKTIDRILIGYDQPGGTGNFRGLVDDLSIQ